MDRLQGTRRDIVRYGSLGIAFSCLLFTITNWKVQFLLTNMRVHDMIQLSKFFSLTSTYASIPQAMQYTSPKAIWNLLFGVNQPSFQNNANSGIL